MFWSGSGSRTVCKHDFAMKYMTTTWALTGEILKTLSQAYLSVAVTGDKYGIFVWVNYYMWKIAEVSHGIWKN